MNAKVPRKRPPPRKAKSAPTLADTATEIRAHDIAITDLLIDQYLPRAAEGDDNACKILLKIMERRARYLGLDATKKLDVGKVGPTPPPTREALMHELRKQFAHITTPKPN